MPLRNVATNYTFEQQRQEINLLAADVDTLDTNKTTTARSAISVTDAGGEGSLAYDSGTGVITYTGPAALPQSLGTGDSPTFNNLTLTGYLAGPATLTIDPSAVGDNTGTVVIAGNLQVDGTTTTINSTTMTVDDLNITLASGAANAAAADTAGLSVDGAGATLYYRSTPDAWSSNKKLLVNQTSENATRANIEVTSTKDASFPQYSYGIMATDDAAYNVNPGSGYGFGYKWNAAGNYAQGGGIRMIKENTSDNDYAGAMLFYTRPMGDGPIERLRISSSGQLTLDLPTNTTSRHIGIVNSTGTIGWTLGNGVTAAARQFVIYDNEAGAARLTINASGTVSDSMGPLRRLGANTQSGAYTLVAGDAGKYVAQATNSASVTVPNGVFSAGDMVTIVNLTATNINIVQGSGLDLNFTADGTTGTRTLGAKGACTILFVSSGTSFISGSGLS